jgi:hypothetical protein
MKETLGLVALLGLCWGCGDDGDVVPTEGDAAGVSDTGRDAGNSEEDEPDGRSLEEIAEEPRTAIDTYASFAEGFFSSYCTSCHGPGGSVSYIDLSIYAGVVEEQATIRCGVSPVQLDDCGAAPGLYRPRFPVGPGARPEDDERQQIVDWIDNGLPE